MGERYAALLAEAEQDDEVRVVVITGAESAFCSGADLGEITSKDVPFEPFTRDIEATLRFSKPLVAAINGPAVGLGLVQALSCDVRFIAADAWVSTAFARRGFVAEFGIAAFLCRQIGVGHASDLLISGRKVSATEAHRIGLAQFIVDSSHAPTAAWDYARDIAEHCSPPAVAVIKQQLRDEENLEFWTALRLAKARQELFLTTPGFAETMQTLKQSGQFRLASATPK